MRARALNAVHLALPVFAGLAAVLVLDLTGLDAAAADLFYDARAGRWPMADAWWSATLVHQGGKWLVVLVAASAIATLAASRFVARAAPLARPALAVFLSIGLGTGTVALLKTATGRHCPREMQRWGGAVPYTSLLEPRPQGVPPGRCFPGGHSSGAWSLFSLYFAARALGTRRPATWLLPALALGAIYSFAQLARGSHFPSHDAASALVCWLVSLAVARAVYPAAASG